MDVSIVKEWAPIVSAFIAPCLIAITKLIWNILNEVREIKAHIKDQSAVIKETVQRVDVHDQLSSSVFGKSISSKLIAEGKQSFPIFHHRKLREDH